MPEDQGPFVGTYGNIVLNTGTVSGTGYGEGHPVPGVDPYRHDWVLLHTSAFWSTTELSRRRTVAVHLKEWAESLPRGKVWTVQKEVSPGYVQDLFPNSDSLGAALRDVPKRPLFGGVVILCNGTLNGKDESLVGAALRAAHYGAIFVAGANTYCQHGGEGDWCTRHGDGGPGCLLWDTSLDAVLWSTLYDDRGGEP